MYIQLLINVCAFCLHKVDSFVITKFDPDIIISYFNQVRQFKGADKAVEAFLKENLTEYCDALRQSYIFEPIKTPMKPQEIIPTYHHIPENLFQVELKQGEQQIRKFRLKNKNQTLTFHSFQCLTLEKELKWFITPAFIQDSAFLFEVEPSFRHVVSKKTTISKGHNEIPARLMAIIDSSGTYPLRYRSNLRNIMNSTSRDPLCDMNPILLTRICTIVSDATQTRLASDDDTLSHTYQNKSSGFYYESDESGERCRIPVDTAGESIFYKMLYCTIGISGSVTHFYVASNVVWESIEVLYYIKNSVGSSSWTASYGVYTIPLLQHIKKYNKVLSQTDD